MNKETIRQAGPAANIGRRLFCPPFGCMHSAGSHQMRGARDRRLLIRQARLRRDWSQDGLCLGICTPSYLSKIEQGKAEPSPEVTELLLRRLGLVWIPEPEDLKPCWNAPAFRQSRLFPLL